VGGWDRRRGLPRYSLLVRARLSVRPIQTISPAFDGLKVFPSLAGLSIARFGRSSFRLAGLPVSQPTGWSALASQSGGLRRIIDAEMS
jgi:hypothetical protein